MQMSVFGVVFVNLLTFLLVSVFNCSKPVRMRHQNLKCTKAALQHT